MYVDHDKCVGCGSCVPYCPMRALAVRDGVLQINQDECVECNICYRSGVCPVGALEIRELPWPRAVRSVFSDPLLPHGNTGVPGRGTEEMKTNDVTHRFQPGYAGIAIEMGRPGTGARFYDVEKVAMAVAKHGVQFEELNPLTYLMADQATGKMKPDILQEKVLSGIIEFIIPIEKTGELLATIKEVSSKIDTVFSLDICSPVTPDDIMPYVALAQQAGCKVSINGKTNVGLGHTENRGEQQ